MVYTFWILPKNSLCTQRSQKYSPSTSSNFIILALKFQSMKWSEVAQSCPTLSNPMGCSPPGFSIHRIQARILQWVAISFFRGSSQPRDRTQVSRIAGRRFNLLSHQGSPDSNWVLCVVWGRGWGPLLLIWISSFSSTIYWGYFPFPIECALSF